MIPILSHDQSLGRGFPTPDVVSQKGECKKPKVLVVHTEDQCLALLCGLNQIILGNFDTYAR